MTNAEFKKMVSEGIPEILPEAKPYDQSLNHAPKRKDILSSDEKKLAVKNALRYFNSRFHKILAKEFAQELHDTGRIYMYRFRPEYEIRARQLDDFLTDLRKQLP
jgi:urocanate hydratase